MLREKTGATPGISQKTENKETETQKTNSIPFAKPIRRPKLILMNCWFRDQITACSHYGCDRYFDGFFAGSENDGELAKMNKCVCSTNFPVCASYLDNRLLRNHSTRFGISILPIFESFVCESQIKRYGVAHRQRNVQHLQKSENLEITHAY